MVTLTIWTNCVAPAAPFVSGGTKATPSRLRVSLALWPSKLSPVRTPASADASWLATGSDWSLLSRAPVGSATGACSCCAPLLVCAAAAMSRNGKETSFLTSCTTTGRAAATDAGTPSTAQTARDETRRTIDGLRRLIFPPFVFRNGLAIRPRDSVLQDRRAPERRRFSPGTTLAQPGLAASVRQRRHA